MVLLLLVSWKKGWIISVLLFFPQKGRIYCPSGGERRLIFSSRTIIIIYTEEKDLFHKLRSSINEFKRIIIEPRNKIENNNFIPTPSLLLCRDEIALCVFIAAVKFPQLLARNPLYTQKDSQWQLFSFLWFWELGFSKDNLLLFTGFKHGLCH